MSVIFVAGTDTGVGKSVVTGLLAGYLADRGNAVVTQKWVETGSVGSSADIAVHNRFMGKNRPHPVASLSLMAPYVFRFPASPHLAAGMEGKHILIDKIKNSVRKLSEDFKYVVAEGTGGLLVPLNQKTLMVDIVKDLKLPVLVVAINRLGAINQVLLSIEALKSRGIEILGVVFNNMPKGNTEDMVLKDNPKIVRKLSGVNVLGSLPYEKNIRRLRVKFAPIGDRIIGRL